MKNLLKVLFPTLLICAAVYFISYRGMTGTNAPDIQLKEFLYKIQQASQNSKPLYSYFDWQGLKSCTYMLNQYAEQIKEMKDLWTTISSMFLWLASAIGMIIELIASVINGLIGYFVQGIQFLKIFISD